MNQPNIQGGSSISTLTSFWHAFQLFPLQFDRDVFRRWYFLPIAYCVLIVILELLIDLRLIYLVNVVHQSWYYTTFQFSSAIRYRPYQNFDNLKGEATDWLFFSYVGAITLVIFLLRRWGKSIPSFFQTILDKGLLRSMSLKGTIDHEYQHFLEDYQQNLLSRKRYIFISFLAIAMVTLFLIVLIPTITWMWSSSDSYIWLLGSLTLILKGLLFNILLSYILGAGVWVMIITSVCLSRLVKNFDLLVQPNHPDHCGGFKSLGTFCLNMSLPLLIVAILLGIYSFGSSFYPELINYQYYVQTIANIGLILLLFPLATVAFLAPLWNIHRMMVAKKRTYEDEVVIYLKKLESSVTKVEEKILLSLDKGKLDEARAGKEELEILRALYPATIEYPTLPFEIRTLLTFFATQIVSIIALILPLISRVSRQ